LPSSEINMGTRSRIAAANADGTFTSIYCHWDGYPSGVGQTLRDHYKDEAKVRELLNLGDLSSLEEEIGTCNAYGRDRGETGVEAQTSADFQELCQATQDCGGEWLYVFKGGQWFAAKGGHSAFGMPASAAPDFIESIDEVLRFHA
jgi:hypothetical protein